MRVLGIDPGSETLGWGVIDGGGMKYKHVAHGVVKTSPKLPFSSRLKIIADGVQAVIEEHSPQFLCVEEAFYAKNVSVAIKLGQVRGVILLLGEQNNLEISEFSPRSVKQTVVGYGAAEKHQVQEMVRILLNLKAKPEPHDAADALALAICRFHQNTSKLLEKLAAKK